MGVIGNWEKWCHQITNVIQELFGHGEERHHHNQISPNCLPDALQNWQMITNVKFQEEKTQGPLKDMWLQQLIYLCVDRTLHLFIVYIYLLGSWITPPVHLHSMAYDLFEEIGKMLLTVCGFFAIMRKKNNRKKGSEILWLEYWDYCAF